MNKEQGFIAQMTSKLMGSDRYILVIGGLGFIGSHTSWEFLKQGYNVMILDNLSNSSIKVYSALETLLHSKFKNPVDRPYLSFVNVDYRNTALMENLLKSYVIQTSKSTTPVSRIKGVVHFAAFKSINESIQAPLKYYDNNVSGLINLCSLLDKHNIKNLIFSSSATVYGNSAAKHPTLTEGLVDSTKCTGLTNPYGRTKWMCEAILSDLAASDPSWNIVALRYFNPIGCDESGLLGEDPRANNTNLMPAVIKALLDETIPVQIFGTDWGTSDGTAIRDFIHVSDLARAHCAALSAVTDEAVLSGYDVFNVGTGKGHSVKEVVATMENAAGHKVTVVNAPRRDGDVESCVADPSKALKTLAWRAEKSLHEGCQDIFWYDISRSGMLSTGS